MIQIRQAKGDLTAKRLHVLLAISAKKSFGAECSDWIEAHGAQRRDVAGGERDGGKTS
jgi:hypothetical protein